MANPLRICVVGPMIGRHPGRVTTQGELLGARLGKAGYSVAVFSTYENRYLRAISIVANILSRHRIDVMLVQTYSGPSFVVESIACWLGRRLGARVVLHMHGGSAPEFMDRHPRWTRRVFSWADALVSPSRYIAHALEARGHRGKIIPNFIDLPAYPYRHRQAVGPRLLWMRAFHPIYNPEMAVRVLAILRETVPGATLAMGGQDGESLAATRQLARQLGVASAVRFLGFLEMADKVREAGAADIFINTNRIDNTPVSVIEACALGLPVVSTRIGGIADLLDDGESGLLVPDGDAAAMAGAVRRLLDEPGLADKLSSKGRLLAEECSWERVHPLWEDLFARLKPGAGERVPAGAPGRPATEHVGASGAPPLV